LFLLNALSGRAVIVLGTATCRTEISSVRTILLGGGLENHLEFISLPTMRFLAGR